MKYVRDGKIVWPYCSSCERRLDYAKFHNVIALTHFWNQPEDSCAYRFDVWYTNSDEIARIIGL